SASDTVTVTLSSDGGHTSRPHLTGDVVYALGLVATATPALLGRRLDPRAGVNRTWGSVRAGSAPNAIPTTGTITGTLRCLDARTREKAENLLQELITQVVAPTGVETEVSLVRGVPPVDNDEMCTRILDEAARAVLGPDALVLTEQSLGGEDFGWYLTAAVGAMARLGVRTPGGRSYDLHRPDLVVDEGAVGAGARFLAQVAAGAGREPHACANRPGSSTQVPALYELAGLSQHATQTGRGRFSVTVSRRRHPRPEECDVKKSIPAALVAAAALTLAACGSAPEEEPADSDAQTG